MTSSQSIKEVLYNATADYLYMTGQAGWGSPTCPNAQYAQVSSSVAGRKQLLAIAMLAKATGSQVAFQGLCEPTNLNYFNVTYIIVRQN